MRSGPSAATTSCSARRQRKRNGGPSGTSATASIGSGRVNSRSGRGAKLRLGAIAAEGLPAGVGDGHLRRHAGPGDLRDMAVLRDQPAHAPHAQPRAQAVDQAVELGLILRAADADLLGRAGLRHQHRQPRHVEAEAGIERVGQRGQPLDEQRADVVRIAQRPRGAGGDAAQRAVGAE